MQQKDALLTRELPMLLRSSLFISRWRANNHTQQQCEEVRHRPLSHLGTKTNLKSSNARDDNAAH
jgi:hypothetical protein